jgi:hypothetical protein
MPSNQWMLVSAAGRALGIARDEHRGYGSGSCVEQSREARNVHPQV